MLAWWLKFLKNSLDVTVKQEKNIYRLSSVSSEAVFLAFSFGIWFGKNVVFWTSPLLVVGMGVRRGRNWGALKSYHLELSMSIMKNSEYFLRVKQYSRVTPKGTMLKFPSMIYLTWWLGYLTFISFEKKLSIILRVMLCFSNLWLSIFSSHERWLLCVS